MGEWTDFPLPDGSYSDDTRPWSQQDVVNYLPTFAELPGTRSRLKLEPVPGLKPYAVVGDGPHRGARDVEGRAFVVSGNTLYRVTATGVAIPIGAIPGTGFVSMTHNQIAGGNELVIGTRDNSYVYNTVTDTLSASGVGLSSVDFLGQMILGLSTDRRFWRHSALADAMTYSDLDVYPAESAPDRLVGGVASQSEWLAFGERTIETFVNSPTENASFQRMNGAVVEKGCANGNTIRRLDNSVFWLGDDLIVYRMQGYQPVPVSTKAMSAAFRACDPAKAFAFTYEDHGYVIYYLTFQDGQTWGYDATNQRWHRRESFGLDRWRLNTLFKSNGEWYGGDYSNGNLYKLEWGYMLEGESAALPRRLRTGVMHSNGNRVFVHALRVLMDSGLPASAKTMFPPAPEGPAISGAAPDGVSSAAYSFSYTTTAGSAPIVRTVLRDTTLPSGWAWNESTATISHASTPVPGGTLALKMRTYDANGLYADHADEFSVMGQVKWDASTATGGTLAGVGTVTVAGATNTPGFISADTTVSSGDWYWEATTGWYVKSGSLINHYGQNGIIRKSDAAWGLALRQVVSGQTDGGAVASGGTLFADVILYPNWVPPPDTVRTARIRNRLSFSAGSATWKIAIDDGAWITIMDGVPGAFSPYACSRGTNEDATSGKSVTIYSRTSDFMYAAPAGALPLGLRAPT